MHPTITTRRVSEACILAVAILCLLFIPAIVQAQVKAVITGPKTASLGDLVVLDVSQSQAQKYKWTAVGHSKSFLPVDGGIRLCFASGSAGDFIFALVAAGTNPNGGAEADVALWTITVGTPSPPTPPQPPTPPTPPVPPTPPQPDVTINDAPGIWCLIVHESNDRLPTGQADIISSNAPGSVRDWLNKHCAKDPKGNPQLRIVDKDDPLDRETPQWKAIWQTPGSSIPWIRVVKDGRVLLNQALPPDPATLLTALKAIGGE